MQNCTESCVAMLSPELIRSKRETQQLEDGGWTNIYQDSYGEVASVVYELFPGIKLIIKDVNRPGFLTNWRKAPAQGFVIEHCWKGRMESQKDDVCMSPAPGDLILYRTDYVPRAQYYPLGYFRSISIAFDLDKLSPSFLEHLKRMGFSAAALLEKFDLDEGFYYVLKDSNRMCRVFEDIHSSPETMKTAYFQLKLFELLLLLNSYDFDKNAVGKPCITRAQTTAAKAAHQYMMDHPFERITIDELAKMLAISASYLKSGFHSLYGKSIKQFDREHKMQLAAEMLRETDLQISEIAKRFLYVNVSKFSAAFQSVHGLAPSEYRKNHQKV